MIFLISASLVTTVVLILLLRPVAAKVGLVDVPDSRKQHTGSVPLIGGLAIYSSLVLVSISFQSLYVFPVLLLVLGFFVVALGVLDDFYNLGAGVRLVAQISVATAMVLVGDVRIESIGAIMGAEALVFSDSVSVIFTVLCAVGVINAINMIDGIDGLSGSLLLISFGALALLSAASGSPGSAMLFALSASILGFLYFNSRYRRKHADVFLGDSGSMFLGLVLVWFFVELTQSSLPALGSVSAGWIFGLPLMDTVSVMVGRVLEKRSPFESGRDHLHHLLLRCGYSVNRTVATMSVMHLTLVGIGVFFANVPAADPFLFWGFVILTVAYFFATRFFLNPARHTGVDRSSTVFR